jgi:hypothetical protein
MILLLQIKSFKFCVFYRSAQSKQSDKGRSLASYVYILSQQKWVFVHLIALSGIFMQLLLLEDNRFYTEKSLARSIIR